MGEVEEDTGRGRDGQGVIERWERRLGRGRDEQGWGGDTEVGEEIVTVSVEVKPDLEKL